MLFNVLVTHLPARAQQRPLLLHDLHPGSVINLGTHGLICYARRSRSGSVSCHGGRVATVCGYLQPLGINQANCVTG